MDNFKITNEGIELLIIPKTLAEILLTDAKHLHPIIYKLYNDNTESTVTDIKELREHNEKFGVEIDFLKDIIEKLEKLDV